tara:strand:+ start:83087 stop:83371 length:285 start_codon:yes stop_codon:yes gene_type:complete
MYGLYFLLVIADILIRGLLVWVINSFIPLSLSVSSFVGALGFAVCLGIVAAIPYESLPHNTPVAGYHRPFVSRWLLMAIMLLVTLVVWFISSMA